jgi:ribosomal protein S18 acetylase RimI-like enzyme
VVEIRAFRPADLEDLYRICVATAAGGDDASTRYRDPRLVGHVYAAPYGVLSPLTVYVAEDSHGVGGYIVGAPDTRDFETRLEAEWWPGLRNLYRDPSDEPRAEWSNDQLISYRIHHPSRTASAIVEPYPAHLHINLMPRLRGCGIGRQLMERWLGAVRKVGSRGAHLAVGAANRRAIRFYRACGFREMEQPARAPSAPLWLVIDLVPKICGKEHANG